jgi:predicted molibdopterin-dependent oxidoreductase YjgC
MFQRLPDTAAAPVRVYIEDEPYDARAGDSVAAALLASGRDFCRTTAVTGAQRAPYCMMGVCFDCLVEIDGVPNRQSCMIAVRPGMRIRRQRGRRRLDPSR